MRDTSGGRDHPKHDTNGLGATVGDVSDTVVYPARTVVTMDPSQPEVEAVAVRDEKVLAAGSLEECASWGPHDVDRRFADHVLVPGMIMERKLLPGD